MQIGVIGEGVVGAATKNGLARGHELLCYDKYKESTSSLKEIAENCSVIFLTVPTPMKKSGEIDLSAIYESVGILNEYYNPNAEDSKTIIVIRSTAVSGTTDALAEKYPKFDFAFNPEFLTDKNAQQDFLDSKRIVIGANSDRVFEVLKQVYIDAKFTCPIIRLDVKTAELVKYASNVMLMSQIITANEIYEICQHLGIDYQQILPILKYDDRIGKNISVPGYDGDRGAGGKCLCGSEYILVKDESNTIDLIHINEVWKKENISVLGINNQWIEINKIGETIDDILEIKLTKGLSIKCNPQHIFTVFEDNVIKDKLAVDLKIGDVVPVQLESLPEEEIFFDLRSSIPQNKRFNVKLYSKKVLTRKEKKLIHKRSLELKYNIMKYEDYIAINSPHKRDKICPRFNCRSYMNMYFKLDRELARLIGYYLAEGHTAKDGCVSWSFGKNDKSYIKDVFYILKSKGINYHIQRQKNVCIIKTKFTPFTYFWKSLRLGDHSYEKRIPGILLKAKRGLKLEILKGYFRGDGSMTISKDGYVTISCASVSQDLMAGISLLLRDKGILPSTQFTPAKIDTIQGRTVNCRNVYTLKMSEARYIDILRHLFCYEKNNKLKNARKKYKQIKSMAYSKYSNLYLLPIKKIEQLGKDYVYGIELNNEKHFLTSNGVITHNCFPKDLNALIYLSREHGYRPDLLEEIWRTNLKFRTKIDW